MNMQIHVVHKHYEMKYPCPYCEYLKTGASHLKKHDVTLHKGERYS